MQVFGWIFICVGALGVWGSMMSDAPVEADKQSKVSAGMFLFGLALVIIAFVTRHYGVIP